jgi:glycerol-1-phosphate dehydrogenase [NAD(P)+]
MHGIDVIQVTNLDGRLDQAAESAAMVISESVSLLVGVGGGRVIDTAKLAAARTGTDFISVPTAISHDGISSPVASLRQRDGTRNSYAAAMPAGIIVDVGLIGSSPPQALRAGVGDLLSNLTAILDWRLADRMGHDRFDAFSAMIGESAARPALDLADLMTTESHEVLAKGLVLSGLAMAAAGTSRPCSGAEHLVSHSLDRILGARAGTHGEQVALGCLVSAAAHGSPLHATLRERFAALGLPQRPADLGLSDELMLEALRGAPDTRPERYTILSEIDVSGRDGVTLLERAFG